MIEHDLSVAKKIFTDTNAIVDGHFVLAKKSDGWYHSYKYVNKDAIYPFVLKVKRLCNILARQFENKGVDVVVGPTVGGVILSQWVAYSLTDFYEKQIFSVFADEVDGNRIIKRGYDAYLTGKKCLIVEDVINSGLTVAKTRDAVLQAGGQLVGVGALCNRSGDKVTAQTLGVLELVCLLDVDIEKFREEDCPICKERGVESVRTDLGKGKEFLARIGKL